MTTLPYNDSLENKLALALAPMMLAIGSFSVAALGAVADVSGIIDEFIAILAFTAIVSAALLIDHVLDDHQLKLGGRIKLMGLGYPLFCVVVSLAAASVVVMFEARHLPNNVVFANRSLIPIAGISCSLIAKLMTQNDRGRSLIALTIFVIWAVVWLPC